MEKYIEKERKKHFQYLQNRNTPDVVEAFFGWV